MTLFRKVPGPADMPDRGARSTVSANREHQTLVQSGVASRDPRGVVPLEPAPSGLRQFATHADDKPKLRDLGL